MIRIACSIAVETWWKPYALLPLGAHAEATSIVKKEHGTVVKTSRVSRTFVAGARSPIIKTSRRSIVRVVPSAGQIAGLHQTQDELGS